MIFFVLYLYLMNLGTIIDRKLLLIALITHSADKGEEVIQQRTTQIPCTRWEWESTSSSAWSVSKFAIIKTSFSLDTKWKMGKNDPIKKIKLFIYPKNIHFIVYIHFEISVSKKRTYLFILIFHIHSWNFFSILYGTTIWSIFRR